MTMKWFRDLMVGETGDSQAILRVLQSKFASFLDLLDRDNRIHALIGELEEKGRGEEDFDLLLLRRLLGDLRMEVEAMIEAMIAIGGEPYLPLQSKYDEIRAGIDMLLPHREPLKAGAFTVPFDSLGQVGVVSSVGNKCSQLGQIRVKLGLSVPDGFAITGWACHQFFEANQLREKIGERIQNIDVRYYQQLEDISGEIRALVAKATVPAELRMAIENAAAELTRRCGARAFSVRSSAVGEDTHFSFAGQYATFLNVLPADLVARYRDVVASLFAPQAMYYYLNLPRPEREMTMGAGCVAMIDARASGVVYTRDPIRPNDDIMLINSVFGLGEYVVDGTLTPDSLTIARHSGRVIETRIAHKEVRLAVDPDGGTCRKTVDAEERDQLSLRDEDIRTLVEYALKIEQLYHCPQDIEWSIDQAGRVFILQARPLRVIEPLPLAGPDLKDLIPLVRGGVTICPGAGAGPVYHARSARDLAGVPEGAVLVAPHSFPGLVTVMQKVSAIVTETGGVANHMATIAREYQVPAITDLPVALKTLRPGQAVTVDAAKGMIYDGEQPQLVKARRPERRQGADLATLCTLRGVLQRISPLGLVHPGDSVFSIDHCHTFHDLTRFCHQRAMEEMFYGGLSVPEKERVSVKLSTTIPLDVNVILVDQAMTPEMRETGIDEQQIDSEPMRHFWNGVLEQGWPARPLPRNFDRLRIFSTSMEHPESEGYSESSFALLGREYMIVGLRMGYHFMTVEGICTKDPQKNYIRMQYKEGGATPERRERRIQLIKDVLTRLEFDHQAKGDFLDTRLVGRPARKVCDALFKLGQLTMLTKQLDMALTNYKVAAWYTRQIMAKLGLE
jgi:pyruvate,water dikinase